MARKCDRDEGNFLCLSHDVMFADEIEKKAHLAGPGEHVLAWNCIEHGPEVP